MEGHIGHDSSAQAPPPTLSHPFGRHTLRTNNSIAHARPVKTPNPPADRAAKGAKEESIFDSVNIVSQDEAQSFDFSVFSQVGM